MPEQRCPLCGEKFSETEPQCPSCGYKLSTATSATRCYTSPCSCEIHGYTYDLGEVQQLVENEEKIVAIKTLMEMTSLGLKDAKDIVDCIENTSFVPDCFPFLDENGIACPSCGSHRVESMGVRGMLFLKKIRNTCLRCGKEFS